MNEHGQDLLAGGVAAALLARVDRPLDHRIHDLQVRRVEGKRHVDVAAGRADVGGEAHVVLHVSGAGHRLQVVLALELAEQLLWCLAEHVHEHVDAAAMRHAENDLLDAARAALLNEIVEHRDQAVCALEREALLPDVTRVQITLDSLRRGELTEDVAALGGRERISQHPVLQPLAQPLALAIVREVGEIGAHLARVHPTEQGDDVPQPHLRPAAAREPGREELGLHVRVGEPDVLGLQHLGDVQFRETERVEVGYLVTALAVDLDEPGDRGLFLRDRITGLRRMHGARRRAGRRTRAGRRAPGRCGTGGRRAHLLEKSPPVLGHRSGIEAIRFVEILDVGRIRAEQRRGLVVGLQRLAHETTGNTAPDSNDRGLRPGPEAAGAHRECRIPKLTAVDVRIGHLSDAARNLGAVT